MMDALEPRRHFSVATSVDALQTDVNNVVTARSTAYTADRYWGGLNDLPRASSQKTLAVNASAFEPFTLDASRLRQKLSNTVQEDLAVGLGRARNTLEISIPTPEGTLARFNIVESSILAPELQAKFPDIRTYAGYGVDDPSAYIRADFTPLGFHAQVLATGSTYYVDPYYHLDQSVYASYYRRDAAQTAENKFPSLAGGDVESGAYESGVPIDDPTGNPTVNTTSGSQLRTYRAAVAANGEYTAFFGGTVTAGLSAVTTAMNRVSGIYETELSIRMTLVANNNLIIFTNPATDNYDNTSNAINQNTTNINAVINSSSYDIGHVFTTGSGGVAGLGVVGTVSKARGTTGLPSPVGDPFLVDFVAHEMGHQFGGNHNFNGPDGARNGGTAYEPGSGSTIMAYAGITGANSDLQLNSDPFFGWISAQEIINRCDNVIPGVGTRTATGNSVPTINAGANFTIPAQTPFALSAVGSDANGDALTYSWEQADLGPATLLTDADNGFSPLFRVFNPATSATRMFPRLTSILSGANSTAAPFGGLSERLPTTNRSLNFRVTARDNRVGGGGINTDDVALTVVNTGAAFSITNLNSATTLTGGSSQAITWNVAGTTGGGINTANVMISMSTDGGNTFPTVLLASTANDGSESFTVPSVNSSTVRFKVAAVGNIFFDITNANVTTNAVISAPTGTPQLAAASDTGVSNSDLITRRNNSTVANALEFSVSGTVAGATVDLFSDGTLIGSAVASGTTTTITTNGTTTLANGFRAITARQTEPAKPQSVVSTAQTIRVDAAAPTGTVIGFNRLVGPHQIVFAFNDNVGPALTGSDLSLVNTPFGTSNGVAAVSYDAALNFATFTFPSAPNGILADGNYALSINRVNVTDVAGNLLVASLSSVFAFLAGDADGDSDVDLDDFTALAANFGSSPRDFTQGDFTYSGAVDLDDFTILAANFGRTLPPLEGSLPRAAGNPFSVLPVDDRMFDLIDSDSSGEII